MNGEATDADRLRVLVVLFAGVLIGALDIAIVGPALPAIRETFGVGDRDLSWVFTTYILFNVVGAPLIAKLSDRYGRRRMYGISLALFGAGSLLVAAAPSFAVVLAGRALQAFGAGGIFPVASAVIADTFPLARRGRALGMIGAVFGIAFLVGPLLGGVLLRWGWQWLFLINLPIVVVVIAASRRILPKDVPRAGGRFDAAGAATLAVFLVSAAWAINRIDADAPASSLLDPRVWPFLLMAAAAGAVFRHVERRASDPVLHPSLFRSRALVAVGGIAACAGLVEAGMVFLPSMAVTAFGVDPSAASFMLLPLVLTLIVGAPLAGQLLDRIGPRPVIPAGLALTAMGLLVLGALPLRLATFYAGGMLVGLGLSALLGAPLRYVVLEEAGEERRGAGQGLLTLFLSAGQLLGAAAIGGLADSAPDAAAGYARAFVMLGVAATLALPLTLLLRPKRSRQPEVAIQDEAGRRS